MTGFLNPDPIPTVHWYAGPITAGLPSALVMACGATIEYPNEYSVYRPYATCEACSGVAS